MKKASLAHWHKYRYRMNRFGFFVNHKFEELGEKTFLHYAAQNSRIELCKTLFGKGADASIDSAYALAAKKGGEVFAAFEPRLLGKLLTVGECSICEERAGLFPFECGHLFCYNCSTIWAKECTIYRQCVPCCPQAKCKAEISINTLQQLLSRQDYISYLDSLTLSFLSSMEDFSWCIHCSSGVISANGKNCNLRCPDCGVSWCPKCSLLSHGNMSCEEAKINQSTEESLNSTWKTNNTKQCPKCKVSIEKNAGGCSHMACRKCSYEFCWICLGPYNGRRTFDNTCPCKKI